MVDFMSQRDFESGGPTPSPAGGMGQGFGQLAQVLAQGPRIRAQAGLTAAETDKMRVETQGMTADQATKADIIARQRELMTLASDPNTARDPAARQRLLALGANDPLISPHLNSILAANFGLAAMSGLLTARQRDAYSGATGVAPFGNTETGQGAALANTLADTRLKEAGATTRTGMTIAGENWRDSQQSVTGRPQGAGPDVAPIIMPKSTAYASPTTPVAPAQQQAEGAPIATVPANAPPGTQPTLGPTGAAAAAPGTRVPVSPQQQQDAQNLVPVVPAGSPIGTAPVMVTKGEIAANPGKYTEIAPAQQQAEAAPTTILTPQGPALAPTGAATSTGQQPVLSGGTNQVQSVGIQSTTWPSRPGTLDLGSAISGLPPPPTPAQRVGAATLDATAANMPATVSADEAAKRSQFVAGMGAQMYPEGSGKFSGGMAGTLGPQAQQAILRRAEQLAATRDPRYFNNWGAATTKAKEELQESGQLPPDASQTADWGSRTFHITGKNVIELAPPGTYAPVTPAPGTTSGTPTAPASTTKPAVALKKDAEGNFWIEASPGKWVKADEHGRPLGGVPGAAPAQAPAQTPAQAPARSTSRLFGGNRPANAAPVYDQPPAPPQSLPDAFAAGSKSVSDTILGKLGIKRPPRKSD